MPERLVPCSIGAVPPRPELAGRKRGVVLGDDETGSILAQRDAQDPEVGAVDVDDEHVGLVRHARFGEECEHVVGPHQRLPHRHVEVAGERGGGLRAQRVGLEPVSAPALFGERARAVLLSVGGTDLDERATANLDALEQRRDQPVLAVLENCEVSAACNDAIGSARGAHQRTRSATARSASACCRRGRSPRRDASARRALRRRPDNTERSGGKGPAFVSLRTVMEPATLRPEQGFLRPGRLP